jgi:hypothetical protein
LEAHPYALGWLHGLFQLLNRQLLLHRIERDFFLMLPGYSVA